MAVTLKDLAEARTHALHIHSRWKREINLADMVANDKWEILWPDGTVDESEPLVENLYAQALEDKTLSAGAMLPKLFTTPARGTRLDRAEKNAQQRKRVMLSYWERSALRKNAKKFYRDWLHTGLMAGLPWFLDWNQPPAARFPFFMILNPRQVFPLGHDSTGTLTHGLVMRQRRFTDLQADWGEDHPAFTALAARRANSPQGGKIEWLEEVWWFDDTQWAVAVGDSHLPPQWQGSQYAPSTASALSGGVAVEWLKPPEPHRFVSCPLKTAARITVDDQPRGALMDIIPDLKIAQNFMARLLDDLDSAIYAPVVLDNIENAHEYGPGAVLIGDGTGRAAVVRDRPPVNFEAQQTVRDILERARRQAFEPPQRSGEAGASIVSAKGTLALMGTFNSELAAAQSDFEEMMVALTSATAELDEKWAPGRKQIWGVDDANQAFTETYDPRTTFRGDYRVKVSYGDRTGLDEQNHLIRLATIKNLGGLSLRTFMEKAGVSEDPLQEERDMAIEQLTSMFHQVLLPQAIAGGDLAALQRFVEKLDDDQMTVRQAVMETIREMTSVPPDGAGRAAGPGQVGTADILRMARSLDRGGIPANAEGQPPSQIEGPLPFAPAVRRGLAAISPGGNG